MKQIFRSAALLAGLACAALSQPALANPSECDAIAGNLVANCGFETGDFTDWTLSGNTGNTGVAGGPTSNFPQYVHSGIYGMYAGPIGSDGYISQTLTTTAGTIYDIGVWLDPSGHTPADFDIEWNGATVLDVMNAEPGWTNPGTIGGITPHWVDETVTALGTGSDLLTISFRDDLSTAGIDDISVVPAGTTAVPEPASLAVFGTALLGLGLLRRKRRA